MQRSPDAAQRNPGSRNLPRIPALRASIQATSATEHNHTKKVTTDLSLLYTFVQPMNTQDLHKVFQALARRQRWCVSDTTLRGFFPAESRNTFYTALSRQVRKGALQRIAPGLYLNPFAQPPADAAERLVDHLRPDDFVYLSLESALHEHGRISQVPNRLTFMTTGTSRTWVTPVGTLEFTHTKQNPALWRPRTILDPVRRIRIATPELAIEDLKHVGRNLDLIETEH